jgi:hypothetical protein
MGGEVATGAVFFAAGGMAGRVEIKNELRYLAAGQGPIALGHDAVDDIAGNGVLNGNEESALRTDFLGTSQPRGHQ